MGALLSFHLLGLYPVISTNQLLVSVPFFSSYSIRNPLLGTTTTVRVANFDKSTLAAVPPAGSNIYVQSVTVRGGKRAGICYIEWDDVVGGGEIVIELGPQPLAGGCSISGVDNQRPSSLETGGFWMWSNISLQGRLKSLIRLFHLICLQPSKLNLASCTLSHL